jgi:hypothetical protein
MRMIKPSLKVSGRVLLAGFLLSALLQGCIEKGAVTVICNPNDEVGGPAGCLPQSH